jgi:hypothetical protein
MSFILSFLGAALARAGEGYHLGLEDLEGDKEGEGRTPTLEKWSCRT